MMLPQEMFENEINNNTKLMKSDAAFMKLANDFHNHLSKYNYSYNFKWMGRPIIQEPSDIVSMQGIIWDTKPDLVIDCGIAHGGSLIFNASMLALLSMIDSKPRKVIGVDIEIRSHNRAAIEAHPMAKWITMIEGSSVDASIIAQVKGIAKDYHRIMLCLDSNHTHAHVLGELNAYADLVSEGCYCIVFDTGVEDLPDWSRIDRPWGRGNNPKTALLEYLKTHDNFIIDKSIEDRIILTSAPNGFLKRIK